MSQEQLAGEIEPKGNRKLLLLINTLIFNKIKLSLVLWW